MLLSHFVRGKHEGIGDNCANRASCEASREPHQSFLLVNGDPAVDKATVGDSGAVFGELLVLGDLKLGFDDVLRVGDEPAEKPADTSGEETSQHIDILHVNLLDVASPEPLGVEVAAKLARIAGDFAQDRGHKAFHEPLPEAFLLRNPSEAVKRVFVVGVAQIFLRLNLHAALD